MMSHESELPPPTASRGWGRSQVRLKFGTGIVEDIEEYYIIFQSHFH